MAGRTKDADPVAEVLAHALGKPGAWQDAPWDDGQVVKVDRKIFCFATPGSGQIGVKCGADRDEADELLVRYPDDVSVMAYIGRYGWNTIRTGGAVDVDELIELVDASYVDVVARLPKSRRPHEMQPSDRSTPL